MTDNENPLKENLSEERIIDQGITDPESKTNRKKMKVAFIAIIFLSLLYLIGSSAYRYWLAATSLTRYNQAMEAQLANERAAKMADTYGGKTPAETLSLYIEAVKKGDYELASKYFIEKNRQAELASSADATQKTITSYTSNLEAVLENIKSGQGSYNENKDGFVARKPILVDFELYPNRIWKIANILTG